MSRLVRNIMSNAFGGVWSAILALVAIPIQIHILGAEAYGLVGFISTMQVILVIFDLGLPSTLIREIARDTDDRTFSRNLIQSSSTIYWIIALIAGGSFLLSAESIAVSWLHVETIPVHVVVDALRLLSLYILISWPLNIYGSTLVGLQHFEILNILKVASATFTQIGGIVMLLLTHDVRALILWLVVINMVFLVIHVVFCYRMLPGLSLLPRVSWSTIKRVWKYAFDLNLISTLAVVYVQTDRILISALLPLRMLGYYNAAYTISRQITVVQEFINSAMLPALSAKAEVANLETLREFYFRYAQIVVYVVALPAFVFIFFGYDILRLWTTQEVADGGAMALTLLAGGFLLNASIATNYTLSIATGHSRIAVWVNLGALLVYVPILTYLVSNYSLNGAALGWVGLNIYYLFVFVPFTQRRILQSNLVAWLRVLLPFVLIGGIIFGAGWWLKDIFLQEWVWLLSCLCSIILYILVGFFLLDAFSRERILKLPRNVLSSISFNRL